jgi:DNA-binding NarL/FixJ family response regulator
MAPSTLGRVLIIDDQEDIRLCLRYMLEADGYEVVGEAEDARVAMDLALTLAPDIIVLDVLMPTMNGVEALPHLRRVAPTAKIIMHSSLSGSYRKWVTEAGADGFVDKTEIIKLSETLRKVMQADDAQAPS